MLGSARRRSKPIGEALEDMEDLYDDAIDSIEEMNRWLDYYSRDPENPEYEPIGYGSTEYKLVSLNNEVEDAPSIIKKPYIEFRNENPLLTGEENSISMMESSVGTNDWTRFQRQVKNHKDFLRDLKKMINKGREELKEAKDELERQKYNKEAMEQRGEQVDIDRDTVMPDETPESISDKIAEELDERLRDEEEDEKNEEENDRKPNMMTPRQFVHYIIMHLKYSDGSRSDYYRTLKNTFPEQARKIESQIYTIRDVHRVGDNDDVLRRPLSEEEIEYIKERVDEDGDISETLERHKEKA